MQPCASLTVSHRLIQGPSSSVFVGPKRKEFVIHKALLCHLSPYFRSALNSVFIEGRNNAVELQDEDPACFQYIVAWMYRGTLCQFQYEGGSSREEAISLCTQTCRLYYLADFLRIEALLAQLLSYLHGLFDRFRDQKIVPLNSDVIVHLYRNTTEASELRAAVMHELVRVWCDHSREVDAKDFAVCLDQVEGAAMTLLTGMRSWREERARIARRTARLSPAPFCEDILNRVAPDVAQRLRNPVVGVPVSNRPAAIAPPFLRPLAAPRLAAAAPVHAPVPPLPRPAAAALLPAPTPHAPHPVAAALALASFVAPAHWNRRHRHS